MLENLAWYALHVRTRFEQECGKILVEKGYEIFRPTYFVRTGYRSVELEKSLFPGYLLCRMMPDVGGRLVTTPGVLRIVGYGGKAAPIDDAEVAALRRITASSVAKMPWRFVPVGCRVRIDSGPLAGTEGFLESVDGRKIVVSIMLLQRSVAAVLDSSTIVTPLPSGDSPLLHGDARLAVALTIAA
jgi:transcription antitermination factor NusG